MEAFHSFWSKPNTCRNQGNVSFPDFELFTMILSALKWKEKNGPIRMITDSTGASYFHSLGLSSIWDQIEVTLDQIPETINPFLFWAAGKLYALKHMPLPCVMLDTDLIIWETLSHLDDYDIVTAHSEPLNPAVYPDPSIFQFEDAYQFPSGWNFQTDAANTAFLYLKDTAFRDHYVEEAIRFFQHVKMDGLNPVTAMCFAEQRILPMCASSAHLSMGYLLHLHHPNAQNFVTHTWGFKNVLRSSEEANLEFCMRCLVRIQKDYPHMMDVLSQCKALESYFSLL